MPQLPELRVRKALGTLTAHGVDFVVVGGVAAILHGGATITRDVDVCFAREAANLTALARALRDLDARLREAGADLPFDPDERTLRSIELLTLDTSAGALDILTIAPGAAPYAQLRRRAERKDLGSFAVLVASLDDLIAMKYAAGRPRDLVAVEELEAIKRLRRRLEITE